MIFVKFIVLLLLGFVIVSLFFGLFYLVNDKGQTNRTVNALSVRIGLSILAIVIIMIAGVTGVIELNPSPLSAKQSQTPSSEDGSPSQAQTEEKQEGSGRKRIE